MDEDKQYLWLIERNHEDYLTWIASWLASLIGIVAILFSVISRQGTLSSNHLVLVWFLYWGLVGGMIFSVYRLVNGGKLNLSWALKLTEKDYKIIRDRAKDRGGLAGYFVYIKNEGKEDETAEIHEVSRIVTYFVHLIFFGILFELSVGKPCLVIVTVFVIFVVSTLLSLGLFERLKKRLKKAHIEMTLDKT
jgi:hypothetical protein